MRLIDADELGKLVWMGGRGNGKFYFLTVIRKIINAAPTVEAIPIEWIEKYGKQNWFDYGTQYNAITCMLKAWKEEEKKQ